MTAQNFESSQKPFTFVWHFARHYLHLYTKRMLKQDWKEKLLSLTGDSLEKTDPIENKPAEPAADTAQSESKLAEAGKSLAKLAFAKKGSIYIRFEKRKGKASTILSEFPGSRQEQLALAKELKTSLGIGGSAKDDEILLQGDVRNKIVPYLQSLGYSLKGDYNKNASRS